MGSMALLLFTIFPPLLYTSSTLRDDALMESHKQARKNLDIAMWLLKEQTPFENMQAMDIWMTRLAQHAGVRLTYIEKGAVIADSDVPYTQLATLDDHRNRPEVIAAFSRKEGKETRYSTTLGKNLIYLARPMFLPEHGLNGVLRIAIPESAVSGRLSELKKKLLGAFLPALLAGLILSYYTTRPLVRSIKALATAAQAMGQGDYNRRIHDCPGSELRPLVDALNDMATGIRKQMTTLTEQKARLEAILDGITDGVMVLDEKGHIQSMNTALTSMLPQLAKMEGATLLEATMLPDVHKTMGAMLREDNLKSAGTLGTGKHTHIAQMENGTWMEITLTSFTDPAGTRKVILLFHDISEREQLEVVRRDFVANVSHELKTPLTSIKGYAELLLDSFSKDPAQANTFLHIILKNANHMSKMVNSLLALARSQHQHQKRAMSSVNMADVIRQVVQEVSPHAESESISIAMELPNAPLPVTGDPDALADILRNLLDNAIKYSQQNSTVVVSGSTARGQVTLCVRDTGPGIPQAAQGRIFERFYRLDRKGDIHKNGSAGLGLAICRRIVKSHGGTIWVESPTSPTKNGAAFFVELAVAP